MISFKSKKIGVLGWGVDTQDVVPWLLRQGAKITVLDKKTDNELTLGEEKKWDIEWKLGVQDFGDLTKFDFLVRSPGVYRYREEILRAEKAGVMVTSKIKIFFDICPAKIVGVTGTKGKGTTSTLVYEILKKAGKKVYLGGNIGVGIFGILDELDKNSWVVLELSSFQLIDLEKSPHIAVVLMTTCEHQDWHSSEEEYVLAKSNIVAHQNCSDFAIVNKDYPNSVRIGQMAKGNVIWVSREDACFLRNSVRLRGEHNLENIAAALAVAKVVRVPGNLAIRVVKRFTGLEHRLEKVGTVSGVTFYNDSFATTPETTVAAIRAFTEPLIIILGGSSKNSNFDELSKAICEAKNVKHIILIGQEGSRILEGIRRCEGFGKSFQSIQLLREVNMEKIVEVSYNLAVPGDVVLLSPACASFDMFKDYKDRGNQFKTAVEKLEK